MGGPQANGGSGVDATSDRVTCSSLESSASLCLTEGLLGADPLHADGSPVKSSGAHGPSATSRLQYSSSPLGRMSMGSGGNHTSAAAAAAHSATQDYATLSDIWNSPQPVAQPSAGSDQPDLLGPLPSPDATATSGSSLEVWIPLMPSRSVHPPSAACFILLELYHSCSVEPCMAPMRRAMSAGSRRVGLKDVRCCGTSIEQFYWQDESLSSSVTAWNVMLGADSDVEVISDRWQEKVLFSTYFRGRTGAADG